MDRSIDDGIRWMGMEMELDMDIPVIILEYG